MKKSCTSLGMAIIIIFLFPINSFCLGGNNFLKGISFKLKGGYQYIQIGDFNTYMSLLKEYYENYSEDYSVYIINELEEFHHGSNLGGEISFMLSPCLRGIIGIEYTHLRSENSVEIPDSGSTQVFTHKFNSIPLTLSIRYLFPLSKRSHFYLKAGAGYYFAWINKNFSHHRSDLYEVFWVEKMHSSDFGVNGGFGFEYSLSKNIYFNLECLGTYARINGFKGHYSWDGPEGHYYEDKGIFYYWEELYGSTGYTVARIYLGKPESVWYRRNIREFVLDLSGVSLILGLRVRLF